MAKVKRKELKKELSYPEGIDTPENFVNKALYDVIHVNGVAPPLEPRLINRLRDRDIKFRKAILEEVFTFIKKSAENTGYSTTRTAKENMVVDLREKFGIPDNFWDDLDERVKRDKALKAHLEQARQEFFKNYKK